MNTKPRSNSLEAKLTPEQTALAFEWLSDFHYEEVARLIAAPEPNGFGIPTSTAAVGRFARDHWDEIARIKANKLEIELVSVNEKYVRSHGFEENIDDGNLALLREKLFATLLNSKLTPADLRSIATVLKVAKDLASRRGSAPKTAAVMAVREARARIEAKKTAAVESQIAA